MNQILTVNNLICTYGKGNNAITAVNQVSLNLNAGESIAIMGPSGCGKSTLLSAIGLIMKPTSGTISLNGQAAEKLTEKQRAQMRNRFLGYLHQDYSIIDEDTAEQNVAIPLEYARPKPTRKERTLRIQTELDAVEMGWARHKKGRNLSGGERQRIALARALVNRPSLILADEPTAALDRQTANTILELILNVRQREAAVIIATHDPLIANLCNRTIHMENGHLT